MDEIRKQPETPRQSTADEDLAKLQEDMELVASFHRIGQIGEIESTMKGIIEIIKERKILCKKYGQNYDACVADWLNELNIIKDEILKASAKERTVDREAAINKAICKLKSFCYQLGKTHNK